MFKIDFNDTYFNTYEEAAAAAMEDFDIDDFIQYGELRDSRTISDILEELARLNSPLYYTLMDKAVSAYCEEWIVEIEEEEED